MGWHQEDGKGKFLSSAATFVKEVGCAGQKRTPCEVLVQALALIIALQKSEAQYKVRPWPELFISGRAGSNLMHRACNCPLHFPQKPCCLRGSQVKQMEF